MRTFDEFQNLLGRKVIIMNTLSDQWFDHFYKIECVFKKRALYNVPTSKLFFKFRTNEYSTMKTCRMSLSFDALSAYVKGFNI